MQTTPFQSLVVKGRRKIEICRYVEGTQGSGKIFLVYMISLDIKKLIKFCTEKDLVVKERLGVYRRWRLLME